MAKNLLILSLLLLVGAAVLGFKTKGLVDQKIADLNMTKSDLTSTKGTLDKTKKDLKTTSDNLEAANTTVTEQKGKIESLGNDLSTATMAAETAKKAQGESDMKLASLQMEYDAYKLANSNTPKDPNATPTDLPAVQAELATTKAQLGEANVAREAFQQRQKVAEQQLADANTQLQKYRVPFTQAGLTGRVTAVNNGWNFVVIDLGDKQGVSVNSPLLVMRGGQMVARLKITSVEPRTSIADVVGGSMAKGQFVQPGDRVVFAGMRGGAANPTQAAGGAPEAAPMPAQGASAQNQ